MAHTVVIGGLGVKSSIALAQLNKTTGQLTITDRFVKAAGPSPAFMAWGKGSNSPAVSNILIANHAGNQGEAMTSMQLYPPYAKQTGSVKTDDPCHISLHPSGRWAATASYDAGTVSVVELLSAPGPAVEVSQQQLQPAATDPAVAAAQGEDGPSAASAEAQAVFLPAELRLGQHTTYPTEVVGKAAHEAKFSPDGTLLYVPCLKSDHIRMFNFNADTGSLTPNDYPAAEGAAAATATDAPAGSTSTFDDINPALLSPAEAMHGSSSGSSKIAPAAAAAAASERNMARLPAGSGPRHVVFHPSLPVAYVLNELDSTIARFDWDTSSGGRLVADFSRDAGRIVSILPPGASAEPVCIRYGVPGVQAGANPPGSITCEEYCSPQAGGELAISNDGRFLYASNRGLCEESDRPGVSNVVVFGVEGSTGALTPLAWEDADGEVNFPRHFSLTPDEGNAFLLVANQTGESVTVLRRDAGSGMLSKVGTVSTAAAGVQQPSFVAVM